MSGIKHLPMTQRAFAASGLTQRHQRVTVMALALAGMMACATTPAGMAETIDTVNAAGKSGTLADSRGRVLILDICASWAQACNVNARVLDEVQGVLAGEPVMFVSLLVDEGPIGEQALRSYRETLAIQHPVYLAGSRVRAGTSVLGEVSYVPRLVVLDKEGRVVIDEGGGVLNVTGLVERVRPLLR